MRVKKEKERREKAEERKMEGEKKRAEKRTESACGRGFTEGVGHDCWGSSNIAVGYASAHLSATVFWRMWVRCGWCT